MHIDQNRTERYSQIDMTFILILMEMVMIVKLLVHIILVKKEEGKRSYQRCNSAHIITEILIM
jgi:FtsZ-interacting cell division protein ZipA